jgi:hypothetical protein
MRYTNTKQVIFETKTTLPFTGNALRPSLEIGALQIHMVIIVVEVGAEVFGGFLVAVDQARN